MNYKNKKVYLLVDGENIDRTLGQILSKKPKSEQRPRWDKVKIFIEKEFQASCHPLFFLNANDGVSGSFIQALRIVDFIPISLTGPAEIKIVDQGIIKTLEAIKKQTEDPPFGVVLVTHDADFHRTFIALHENRQLAMIAFKEYLSGEYENIPKLRVYDLEDDVKAFKEGVSPLPRLRSVHIDQFNPEQYL